MIEAGTWTFRAMGGHLILTQRRLPPFGNWVRQRIIRVLVMQRARNIAYRKALRAAGWRI